MTPVVLEMAVTWDGPWLWLMARRQWQLALVRGVWPRFVDAASTWFGEVDVVVGVVDVAAGVVDMSVPHQM